MTNHPIAYDPRILLLRVTDLRAEFEAQIRAVSRLEEQFRKEKQGDERARRQLAAALQRELAEMLANNTNIRTLLSDLAVEAGFLTRA